MHRGDPEAFVIGTNAQKGTMTLEQQAMAIARLLALDGDLDQRAAQGAELTSVLGVP